MDDLWRWFEQVIDGIDCTDPETCSKAGSAAVRLRKAAEGLMRERDEAETDRMLTITFNDARERGGLN